MVYLSIKSPKKYPYIKHMKDDANGKYEGVFGARVQKLRKDFKKEGYDGVVVRNSMASPGMPDYWVAFATEQIKSAISG